MSASEPSRLIKLFGTEVPDVKGRTLRAGPLSAVLDNGALRYIRLNDIEVLRAIAFLVRDENWGTFTPAISNLEVKEGADGFTVSYNARCSDARRAIVYKAAIIANTDGSLSFSADATPETDFLTNRTGFVVLHPLTGVAGCPVEVEHTDGRKVKDKFPEIINPIQPFLDIRALTHEVMPGLKATCRMEGYAFEMEDHRNWTDASFKTYVRPLAEPWPYTIPADEAFQQAVTLTFAGKLPAAAAGGDSGSTSVEVTVGSAAGSAMPQIGLGVPAEEGAHAVAAAPLVKKTGLQLLVCQFDGRRSDNAEAAKHFRALAEATGAAVVLEIIIAGKPGKQSPAAELAPIAEAVRQAGLKPAAVTVSPAPHLKAVLPGTPFPPCSELVDIFPAARAAFPGVPLGGGMFSYFTELNRHRPPAELLDFVTHTTAPIVHAADDISLMETLEALPYVIHSTRQFIAGKPYRVGPSAIPARDNPYGKASAENPDNGRVCLARMDPRQRGLVGAAWTLGYIAAFARGGLDAVTIGAPTGPAGIIARKTDYPQPWFDGLAGPAVYPLYHVIAGLAAAAGDKLLEARSSNDASVVCLAHQAGVGKVLWLANLTDGEQFVAVKGLEAGGRLHLLDEQGFVSLATDSDWLKGKGETFDGGRVRLGAYAVARLTG